MDEYYIRLLYLCYVHFSLDIIQLNVAMFYKFLNSERLFYINLCHRKMYGRKGDIIFALNIRHSRSACY